MRTLVFAGSFGMSSALGVTLSLYGHAGAVLELAILLGIAEAVTLAGAEWESPSPNGLGASAMLGTAAGVATAVPAIPYQFTSGAVAEWWSVAIAAVLCAGAAWFDARPAGRTWLKSAAQTYCLVTAVFVAVLVAGVIMRGRL